MKHFRSPFIQAVNTSFGTAVHKLTIAAGVPHFLRWAQLHPWKQVAILRKI
jgi:hypothetical protein